MHATSPYFFDSRGCNKSCVVGVLDTPPSGDSREHVFSPAPYASAKVRAVRATARYILKSKWNEKAGLLQGPGRVVRITVKVTSNLPHSLVEFFLCFCFPSSLPQLLVASHRRKPLR